MMNYQYRIVYLMTCLFGLMLSLSFQGCREAEPGVYSYPAVPGLATSDKYTVIVNGVEIWTEKFRTSMDIESLPEWFTSRPYTSVQQEVHFASFSSEGEISVSVKVPGDISIATVRPSGRGIEPEINGNVLSFTLQGPDKLYIEVDDLPPLCFFANPAEEEVPSADDPGVIYFGPGRHHPGYITLADNQTLYIAPGAIVYGGIRTDGATNIRVTGRGILDGAFEYDRMVRVDNSENVLFEGITIRNGRGWINTVTASRNVKYDDVKVVSFGPSGDGINPVGSQNVTISNCFFRCTDDCVAIKSPQPDHVVEDILIENNTMVGFAFSDGVTIGFETRGPYIRNVVARNNDILLSRGGSRVDGHSGFSIVCDGPSLIIDILFEDIRVEQADEKLFELIITEGRRYGDDPPGNIRNVTVRNVTWFHEGPVSLEGFGELNNISGVFFEDCFVDGRPLSEMAERVLHIGPFVEDVKIVNYGSSISPR
ncbi:MAG: hypothetical protein EA408_00545 [Marinilabiliales bacterium]|nr:MAG: hypothetical protein EA408_00545 [Marinilabiliales bacterium]